MRGTSLLKQGFGRSAKGAALNFRKASLRRRWHWEGATDPPIIQKPFRMPSLTPPSYRTPRLGRASLKPIELTAAMIMQAAFAKPFLEGNIITT